MMKFNFLHIHTTDIKGGAAIESYRLHKALLKEGHGSHILCGRKYSKEKDSTPIVPGLYGGLVNAAVGKFFNSLGLQSFGYPSSFFLKFSHWIKNWADVVILRNLHGWYSSIGILPWIAKRVPIIWRLPDMWAFTGHCAYSYDCERWKTGCGKCPYLKSYPALPFDTTHFLWLRKRRIYQKLVNKLIIVSPSKWLLELVKQSPLLKDFRIEHIPTAVDLQVFKPESKIEARNFLNLPQNDKVIIFVRGSKGQDEIRKGEDLLWEIIGVLSEFWKGPSIIFLILGGARKLKKPSIFKKLRNIKLLEMGFIKEAKHLVLCYNAGDVFLSLSRADNLPNTMVEAAACGLPIITLNSGGCSEILENGKSGYVAKNLKDVVEFILQLLRDENLNKEFSKNARRLAEEKFSMLKQVNSFVNLAMELIKT
jgi:glycosyltransferase involved in cell wall biosynthesis